MIEHNHTVYRYQNHYGYMSGGRAAPGAQVYQRWWEKECLNLEEMRKMERVAEMEDMEEEEGRYEKD